MVAETNVVPVVSTDSATFVGAQEPLCDSDKASEISSDADETGGTLWAAWANLTATMLGSSIVLLPSFVSQLGMVGASLAFFAPAALSAVSMRILIQLADAACAARDYTGVAREFLGPWGDRMAFAAQALWLPPIGCLAFAVEVLPQTFASVSPVVACSLALVVAAPFACMTSLERLSKASTFGIMTVLYAVVVIMVQGLSEGQYSLPLFAATRVNLYFIILAESICAFGGEVAVIELYLEVSREKRKQFVRWVVDTSMATIFVAYTFVAAVAYVLYGDGLRTNVLLNLSGSVWASAAQVGVVVSNTLRAPLFCVLFYVTIASKFPDTFKRVESVRAARPVLQLVCLVLSGLIAAHFHHVGTVLAILGGTAGVAIAQVLPSLAWLQARRNRRVQRSLALDAAACFMLVVFPPFSIAFLVALGRELAGAV